MSRQPEVTVTFDQKKGHAIFTIGGGQPSPTETDSLLSQASESGDPASAPLDGEATAANNDTDLQDDRDMIVGAEDLDSPIRVAADTQPDQAKKARAYRAEYQSLFSRMRNG